MEDMKTVIRSKDGMGRVVYLGEGEHEAGWGNWVGDINDARVIVDREAGVMVSERVLLMGNRKRKSVPPVWLESEVVAIRVVERV